MSGDRPETPWGLAQRCAKFLGLETADGLPDVDALFRALGFVRDQSPWMTARECAAYLGWRRADGAPDADRVYQARHRHGLPATHMGGSKSLRFHRLFIDEWVKAGDPAAARPLEARLRELRAHWRRPVVPADGLVDRARARVARAK